MPDTNKPNPNYVNAPFEIREWAPVLGPIHWKEVGQVPEGFLLEGTLEDGRKLRRVWRWDAPRQLFKPGGWAGEKTCCSYLARLDALLARMQEELPRIQEPTITVKGGTVLTLAQAKDALESAMQIIESVGTTGIHDKCAQANNWMLRFFPNWA
jgi:hypothetical protein